MAIRLEDLEAKFARPLREAKAYSQASGRVAFLWAPSFFKK